MKISFDIFNTFARESRVDDIVCLYFIFLKIYRMEICMKIGIIGAGASGLIAACFVARGGADVTIIEHSDRVGKKLLNTGNGKCNFTNIIMSKDKYYDNDFAMSVINKFGNTNTIEFFGALGILPDIFRDIYVYPNSGQASSILDVLRFECERLEVEIKTGCKISDIKKSKKFVIKSNIEDMTFDKLILATGSCAWPSTGSDGSGYELAKGLGHNIVEPLPALCALYCDDKDFFTRTMGVRQKGSVKVVCDGEEAISECGELQINKYGLSGIPVFQISRIVSRWLSKKKKVSIYADFLPDVSDAYELLYARSKNTYRDNEHFGIGIVHKKLWDAILHKCDIPIHGEPSKIGNKKLKALAHEIKACSFEVIKTAGFENAQVCTGGVSIDEIDENTMQSKIVDGLYFAGEIVDVDGMCGGYNLQWAWSSGVLAGKMASRK